MSTVTFRVTIEGPQGVGKTQVAHLVAGQLQRLGCKAIHILDEGANPTTLVKADAEIIVKQLRLEPPVKPRGVGEGDCGVE